MQRKTISIPKPWLNLKSDCAQLATVVQVTKSNTHHANENTVLPLNCWYHFMFALNFSSLSLHLCVSLSLFFGPLRPYQLAREAAGKENTDSFVLVCLCVCVWCMWGLANVTASAISECSSCVCTCAHLHKHTHTHRGRSRVVGLSIASSQAGTHWGWDSVPLTNHVVYPKILVKPVNNSKPIPGAETFYLQPTRLMNSRWRFKSYFTCIKGLDMQALP